MSACPWHVSAAAVRAWQRIERSAPRDFDEASDALIELCADVWRERYSSGERAPKVTKTGAYAYESGKRYNRVQLIVSASRQLVDVVPRSTSSDARRGR